MNIVNYIIVQAGGKGSRMGRLTRNKPKALVPVGNLPMIMHLFRKYPDKKFIVIGDYLYDVLDKYLHKFAEVDYQLVCGQGKNGTCAGMRDAISLVPFGERFMVIWCDLILPENYEIPESDSNIIGISKEFPCRWKYENGVFSEEQSQEHGVAGCFIFTDKSYLLDVPEEGEFVRWLKGKKYKFEEQGLYGANEYGLYHEWEKIPRSKCRPFNKIRFEGDKVYKEAVDDQGKKLAVCEAEWYKKLEDVHFDNIPDIYGYEPICMERVEGNNIYEYIDISYEKKKAILGQIIECLSHVHNLESAPVDAESYREAYLTKTYGRLEKIQHLVPFANDEKIMVNGRKCRNIFFHKKEVENLMIEYLPKEFKLIHGDCTFSNIILKNGHTPILIDPRGYFGNTKLFGDEAYDWAKLYYSLYSNYDQFNLKKFDLFINENDIQLTIASNNWESLENDFFTMLSGKVTRKQMKLLLAIIWLSLTTYAWEDYDSICGAFYNGLYYLEEVL